MQDPKEILAVWAKTARTEAGMTQVQLAEKSNIESRTIIKIEGGEGNPTFTTLFSMVRALHKPSDSLFFPELYERTTSAKERLRLLIEECTEREAEVVTSICQSVLQTLRQIENDDENKPTPQGNGRM